MPTRLVAWRNCCNFGGMEREEFERKKKYAGQARPSMKRRRVGHDYSSRRIYMVTLAVEGRRPLLGTLTRDASGEAVVVPSPLGRAVLDVWNRGPLVYPSLSLIETCLMPDHFHAVLFITEPGLFLTRVVTGFTGSCRQAYRDSGHCSRQWPRLWEPGFNDLIVEGPEGMLQRVLDYVRDNPRRAMVKRESGGMFRVTHMVELGGVPCDALGNRELLSRPRLQQVQVTRRLPQEALPRVVEDYVSLARDGAVLVSPFVSPGEVAVKERLLAEGLPLVKVVRRGFTSYSKPGGELFEACAAGRVLLVSPWEHSNRFEELRREKCLAMNDFCSLFCTAAPLEAWRSSPH